jgi:fermentation-respiration switch protein FrsA (DUF1100 family)
MQAYNQQASLQAQLDRLKQENLQLADELARCREQLREQTLRSARRSPDEFLALFPSPFPEGDWSSAEHRFEDCWFLSSDGLRLHGWYLAHPAPKAVVLHLHGNAGNVSHRAPVAERLHELGCSTLLLDYRGYGRSEGTPTVQGLLTDARAARKYLAARLRIAEADIVLLGESIGGAVAVDLAADDGARGLILENTFSSLRDVAGAHYPQFLVSMLLADKLNSAAKIGKYKGPLLQVHGTHDTIVPLASAKTLFSAAAEPKTFLELAGHDHNDPLPESYYLRLQQFVDELPAAATNR